MGNEMGCVVERVFTGGFSIFDWNMKHVQSEDEEQAKLIYTDSRFTGTCEKRH